VPANENGIGIMNVKKRLALLYPGMHQLEINGEEDFFVVSLTLQLQPVTENKPAAGKTKSFTETFASNDTALPVS
jgi:hypothetical protein